MQHPSPQKTTYSRRRYRAWPWSRVLMVVSATVASIDVYVSFCTITDLHVLRRASDRAKTWQHFCAPVWHGTSGKSPFPAPGSSGKSTVLQSAGGTTYTLDSGSEVRMTIDDVAHRRRVLPLNIDGTYEGTFNAQDTSDTGDASSLPTVVGHRPTSTDVIPWPTTLRQSPPASTGETESSLVVGSEAYDDLAAMDDGRWPSIISTNLELQHLCEKEARLSRIDEGYFNMLLLSFSRSHSGLMFLALTRVDFYEGTALSSWTFWQEQGYLRSSALFGRTMAFVDGLIRFLNILGDELLRMHFLIQCIILAAIVYVLLQQFRNIFSSGISGLVGLPYSTLSLAPNTLPRLSAKISPASTPRRPHHQLTYDRFSIPREDHHVSMWSPKHPSQSINDHFVPKAHVVADIENATTRVPTSQQLCHRHVRSVEPCQT